MRDRGQNSWFLLVVDDSDSVATLLCRIAGMIPHLDAKKAYSAEAALEIAKSRTPDLVISDLYLPKKDGKWLLTQLRANGIDCPFIVFTSCSDTRRIIEMYSAGASRYMAKPSPVREIYVLIQEALPEPVYFEFQGEPESLVYVAGDFNEWNAHQYQLMENPEPGHFQATMPMSLGRHEYKFIVNDQGVVNSLVKVKGHIASPLKKGIRLP